MDSNSITEPAARSRLPRSMRVAAAKERDAAAAKARDAAAHSQSIAMPEVFHVKRRQDAVDFTTTVPTRLDEAKNATSQQAQQGKPVTPTVISTPANIQVCLDAAQQVASRRSSISSNTSTTSQQTITPETVSGNTPPPFQQSVEETVTPTVVSTPTTINPSENHQIQSSYGQRLLESTKNGCNKIVKGIKNAMGAAVAFPGHVYKGICKLSSKISDGFSAFRAWCNSKASGSNSVSSNVAENHAKATNNSTE